MYGRSKYKNNKVTVDNIQFDSKSEAARYSQLKIMEGKGLIDNLELQPAFIIQDSCKIMYEGKKKTQLKIKYIADFMYIEDGKVIVEDVKSLFTSKDSVYKIKKKMMIHQQDEQGFDIFREYIVYNKSRHEVVDTARCKDA